MKRVITLFVLLWTCLTLGCASATPMGPLFPSVTQVPDGKAVVYVYKAKVYGGGLYRLTANGEAVTQLQKGGYYPYVADPGTVEFAAWKLARVGELIPDPLHRLEISVSAGEIRHIKITSGFSPQLVEVSPEEARKELKKCKLLPEWSD